MVPQTGTKKQNRSHTSPVLSPQLQVSSSPQRCLRRAGYLMPPKDPLQHHDHQH